MDYISIPGSDVVYNLPAISSIDFEGFPPIRNVREESPNQAGTRIVNRFYNERSGSLMLNVFKRDKNYLMNLFSPDRSLIFNKPFIYHKELRGGVKVRGSNGSVIEDTGYFSSPTGEFVDLGGLSAGSVITIAGTEYAVDKYISDSVIIVVGVFPASADNVQWSYTTATVYRELEFYVNGGFNFIRSARDNIKTLQVLDIIAGNPHWLGYEQTLVWGDVIVRSNKLYPMTYPAGELYDIYKLVTDLTVHVSSDIAVRPVIRIDGFMTIFRLDNKTNSTYIEYTQELAQGEYVIIDLPNATATLYPSEENVLKHVNGDLISFKLLPFEPNELQVNTDAITLTSLTSVTWRNLYLGSQYDRV